LDISVTSAGDTVSTQKLASPIDGTLREFAFYELKKKFAIFLRISKDGTNFIFYTF